MTQRADGRRPNRPAVNPELPTANKAKKVGKDDVVDGAAGKQNEDPESATEQTASEEAAEETDREDAGDSNDEERTEDGERGKRRRRRGRRGGRRRNRNTAEQTEDGDTEESQAAVETDEATRVIPTPRRKPPRATMTPQPMRPMSKPLRKKAEEKPKPRRAVGPVAGGRPKQLKRLGHPPEEVAETPTSTDAEGETYASSSEVPTSVPESAEETPIVEVSVEPSPSTDEISENETGDASTNAFPTDEVSESAKPPRRGWWQRVVS